MSASQAIQPAPHALDQSGRRPQRYLGDQSGRGSSSGAWSRAWRRLSANPCRTRDRTTTRAPGTV